MKTQSFIHSFRIIGNRSNMADRMVRIDSFEKLNYLKESYQRNAETYITYIVIKGYIGWMEQDPTIKNLNFFSLNGDISDGTFVVIDRYNAYADTLNNNDHSNLTRLLNLLDFTKGYTFYCTRSVIRPSIMQAIENAAVDILCDDVNLLYRCSKEIASEFQVESLNGIQLRRVGKRADIEHIHAVWPHRSPYTLTLFKRLMKYNPSIGAFKDDGTLVAWILRDPMGYVGALQTDDQHFGKGYGKLVTKCLAKQIAMSGDDVYAAIYESNIASCKLFDGLGFDVVGQVVWICTKYRWESDGEEE